MFFRIPFRLPPFFPRGEGNFFFERRGIFFSRGGEFFPRAERDIFLEGRGIFPRAEGECFPWREGNFFRERRGIFSSRGFIKFLIFFSSYSTFSFTAVSLTFWHKVLLYFWKNADYLWTGYTVYGYKYNGFKKMNFE